MEEAQNGHRLVYLATTDSNVIALLREKFPDHTIMVADKELYNKNVSFYIEQSVNWKKSQSIDEARKDPKQIEGVMEISSRMKAVFGRHWFTLTDLCKECRMKYSDARDALDLIYAFGFLAKKTIEIEGKKKPQTIHQVNDTPEYKIEYLQKIKGEKMAEIVMIDNFIKAVGKELTDKPLELPKNLIPCKEVMEETKNPSNNLHKVEDESDLNKTTDHLNDIQTEEKGEDIPIKKKRKYTKKVKKVKKD